VENGITRVTQNRQADMDEGQTTEMGSKWTMPDTSTRE
jgi:CRISPR-associated protein Csd2